MKLFNIFKKENKKATVNIQKMDKTQLEKVVGGTTGGGAASAAYAATGLVKTTPTTSGSGIGTGSSAGSAAYA